MGMSARPTIGATARPSGSEGPLAVSRRQSAEYDVVVAGGSIAGCTAALGYARHGLTVCVCERRPSLTDYKVLCTHFVQPSTLPTLRWLGLDARLEWAGAVRTKAAFWTRAGWIDPPGGYSEDPATAHAYNIERRVLDPLLRHELGRHGNVDLRMDCRVTGLTPRNDGWTVQTQDAAGDRASLSGRVVVAADGRRSALATLLGNAATRHENQRAAYFGYFEGIPAPREHRSLFLLGDGEMGFVYPLAGERTLLSVYLPKARAAAWRAGGELSGALVRFVDAFPDLPNLAAARPASPVFGYTDYPNLARRPVHQGVAFIGDAALSLDPMSGVGCGFAMISARQLVEATAPALDDGTDLGPGLERFAAGFEAFFQPHAHGIRADSLIAKSEASVLQTYRRIVASPRLQHDFIALTGRLIPPKAFQQSYVQAALAAAGGAGVKVAQGSGG